MKLPKYLLFLLSSLLFCLSLFVLLKSWNASIERDYIGKAIRDRDTITISGEGKISAKPDLAKIDVGVYSEGGTVAAVSRDNTTKTNAIISALKAQGVAEADIQTSNYNLQPKIDYTDNRQRITGYTLSQVVSVKLRNLEGVGDAIDAVTSAGANQIYGIQFTIDDPTSVQDEARIEAIENAREKAEKLSRALGLKILKVVTFSESSGGSVPSPMYYRAEADAMKQAAPDIQAGSLDVMMNVAVTFEVR